MKMKRWLNQKLTVNFCSLSPLIFGMIPLGRTPSTSGSKRKLAGRLGLPSIQAKAKTMLLRLKGGIIFLSPWTAVEVKIRNIVQSEILRRKTRLSAVKIQLNQQTKFKRTIFWFNLILTVNFCLLSPPIFGMIPLGSKLLTHGIKLSQDGKTEPHSTQARTKLMPLSLNDEETVQIRRIAPEVKQRKIVKWETLQGEMRQEEMLKTQWLKFKTGKMIIWARITTRDEGQTSPNQIWLKEAKLALDGLLKRLVL